METGKEEAVSQDNLMNIKKFVNNPDKMVDLLIRNGSMQMVILFP